MNQKFDAFVAVFFSKDGENTVKFVTEVDRNTASWEAGKPAMKLSESFAKDIVFGLTLNGFAAAVVRVLHGVEFRNGKE